MEAPGLLFTLASFGVAIGLLVFVHEWGHYYVARLLGVRAEAFSIGFGPELLGWTDKRGTRWRLSAIPLGGYVKFLGDADPSSRPDAADLERLPPEVRARCFHFQPLWARAAIIAAGPAINFAFAVLLFTLVFTILGRPYTPPVIGTVDPASTAAEAGLEPWDRVIRAGGRSVDRFEDLVQEAALHPGLPLSMTVMRDGQARTVSLTPEKRTRTDRFGNLHTVGYIGVQPVVEPVVGQVLPDSPADRAGLRPGDRIVAVGGRPVDRQGQVVAAVQASGGAPLALTVERDGRELSARITPEPIRQEGEAAPVMRLGFAADADASREVQHYGPFSAFAAALGQTGRLVEMMLEGLKQIVLGLRPLDDLGGPVKIAKLSGEQASLGLYNFLVLLALVSINLGLVNLFPIPVLDGGHLLFYAIEAFRGSPVSEKVLEWGYAAGLALVIGLMIFLTWNDIVSL